MPKKHVSGNYKQKNKPFKGANKNKSKFKIEAVTTVTKKINKKEQTKLDKKNQIEQLKQNKLASQDTKLEKDIILNKLFDTNTKEKVFNTIQNSKPPRIIALIPFNKNANAFNIKNGLEQYIKNLQAQNEEITMDDSEATQNALNKISFKFPYFQFFANPKTMQGLVKENFIFTACDRDLQSALDMCKVADIICPVLSCSECDLSQTNLTPYESANAFDDFAYRVMSCLRIQGLPSTVNVLQDVQNFTADKRPKVKKLFSRFFAGEFSDNFVTLEDENSILTFLRKLQGIPQKLMEWRDNRGYLLADQVSYDQQTQLLEVTGFLKGNYLNANQLIHVTGYDDYQIQKIEVLQNPYKMRLKSKKSKKNDLLSQHKRKMTHNNTMMQEDGLENEESMLNQTQFGGLNTLDLDQKIIMTQEADPNLQESLEQVVKKDMNKIIIKNGEILNAIDEDEEVENQNIQQEVVMGGEENQGLDANNVIERLIKEERINKKQQQQQQQQEGGNMEGDMEEEDGSEMDEGSDISFDENEQDDKQIEEMMEEKKNLKLIQMVKREEDELMFEDEIEYDPNISLKERFGEYQAIKSFKTSEWSPYENLPDPYEQIYTFKQYSKTKRLAMAHAQENAFVYSGFYIKIYLKNFPAQLLQNHSQKVPFILSGMLRHERKMTQVHLKVKRNPENEIAVIESKKDVEIHLGFRRFVTQPIYSKIFPNNQKTKYEKKITDQNIHLASFYYPCVYSGNALIFENENNKQQAIYGMSGEIFKVDPMHIILKRIILCGYPHKIHKRRAVIKYMFFNIPDIRYFQPVELRTKHGYKGHIVEPLGTHGLMKCQFNSGIKQHDVVQLHLYKRAFPKNIKI